MRLLITGAAGFIGSNFTRRLLTGTYPGLEGARVTVLDKLTYAGVLANLDPIANDERYSFVEGDICDADLLAQVVPGHDAIVHFAAESHVDRSISEPSAFVLTNVLGTQKLLQAAVECGVERFLHVSTDEVYGSIDEGSWTEESPLEPNSPYAASKASSDLLVRAFHRTFGLDTVITRCSNNYGPYQFPEKVIPLFVTNLMEGKNVPLYGDGLNLRDWLHFYDLCAGISLARQKRRSGGTYNMESATELTNLALTHRLLTAMGADESAVETVPDRKGHDRRYSLDISKIHEELGYSPQIDLDRGLADTIEWYRTNAAWWEPLRQRS